MRLGASLSLRDLGKSYGASAAVHGVSLSLEAGRFLTLLGPSGSGKTTTLMMIAGFVAPTGGEIFVDDQPITAVPAHKRDIGMVFQNYALFPHLTVAENVRFPLKMRGIARSESADRVATFLKMVGLEAFSHRYPHQLSGGQQQRVALARALVFSPSIVLMDEPLGALDRRLRLRMQEEIKTLQRELGLTVVYVTHDQEEALTMSDDVAVMDGGRIASFGSPREIYERPDSRFVADFIGESNFIPCRLERGGDRLKARLPAGGLIEIAAGDDVAEGDSATIFVRPERMRLCGEADDFPNKLPGRVVGELYLGDASLFRVDLSGGVHVRAKRPNRGLGMPVVVGDELFVGWKPEDGVLLRD